MTIEISIACGGSGPRSAANDMSVGRVSVQRPTPGGADKDAHISNYRQRRSLLPLMPSATMNTLVVLHHFLPRHVAGSEVYTFRMAQSLQRSGHRVQLSFTEIRPDRPQYELTRGEYEGLPYFEVVHNRTFTSFRE